MEKLSAKQSEVIGALAGGATLVRVQGGFWTASDRSINAAGIPEWWVTAHTVRALERLGLLRRAYRFTEEWRDDRVLAGR